MRTAVVALTALLALTGCTATVDGKAVREAGMQSASGPRLTEAQLDDVMLSIGELNGIVGATQMTVTSESDTMIDTSAEVSDPGCVGALYGAAESVYADSGWTAVRDQIAREPFDDNDHWVQQSAVLYPSAVEAGSFLDASRTAWEGCMDTDLEVVSDDSTYVWEMAKVDVEGDVLTQLSEQQDAEGWACQHALAAVSNLTVEAWACGYSLSDEATTIANEMVKAAKR